MIVNADIDKAKTNIIQGKVVIAPAISAGPEAHISAYIGLVPAYVCKYISNQETNLDFTVFLRPRRNAGIVA